MKLTVLSQYAGGTPKCACCGETEPKFLSIDHINGGGLQERMANGGRGATGFYLSLKRRGYPEGYQVLCHNCNQAKGHYGACPHAEGR